MHGSHPLKIRPWSGDDVVDSPRTVLDYGVTLAKHDLDTNGFISYLQSRGKTPDKIDEFKEDIDNYSEISDGNILKISDEMKQYALGNSDLTFDQLTPRQMKELVAIQDIAAESATDNSSSWNEAIDDYYQYITELGE